MKCAQARKYFDELAVRPEAVQCRAAADHLRSCASCSGAFARWQAIVASVRSTPAPQPPPRLAQEISAAVLTTNFQHSANLSRKPLWRPAYAALAFAAVAAVAAGTGVTVWMSGGFAGRQHQASPQTPKEVQAQPAVGPQQGDVEVKNTDIGEASGQRSPSAGLGISRASRPGEVRLSAIAGEFGVSEDSVRSLRDAYRVDNGGVYKAFAMAQKSGRPVSEILAMKTQGKMGWGQIAHRLKLQPGTSFKSDQQLNNDAEKNAERNADNLEKQAEQRAEQLERKMDREKAKN